MLIPVTDPTCVYEARRLARNLARDAGLSEEDSERAAIVATELVSNIAKHAGSGEVVLQRFDDVEGRGIEIVAIDRGPGIADLARAMCDGHSTSGTAGQGLGAVSRLAEGMHVYSRPGLGTAVVARLQPKAAARPEPRTGFIFAGHVVPLAGERESGDAIGARQSGARASLCLADGLGHGPLAAGAARAAVTAFELADGQSAQACVAAIHAALRPTRGAAVAIAVIDVEAGVVEFSGIGNVIGAMAVRGSVRRLVSDHGTAGHLAGRIRAETYRVDGAPLVLMHSDGLKSGWSLESYPGLSEAHPALVAGVLFRDWRRGRDDTSIIAVRWGSSS